MLDSLPSFTGTLLSDKEVAWENAEAAPLRPGNQLVTPEEPTTLALGLVGAGLLAIYLAARGLRNWRRDQPLVTRKIADAPAYKRRDGRDTTPRRGAA